MATVTATAFLVVQRIGNARTMDFAITPLKNGMVAIPVRIRAGNRKVALKSVRKITLLVVTRPYLNVAKTIGVV